MSSNGAIAVPAVLASEDRTMPTEYGDEVTPNYYCRGRNGKTRKYCKSRAGLRTAHPGRGRCFRHGGQKKSGDARLKRARYSSINTERIGELIAEHMADADPLNVMPEIAAARAIFQDYLERYHTITAALVAWHDTWEGKRIPIGEPEKKALLDSLDELEALTADASDETKARLELARSAVAFLSTPQNPKPRRIMDISEAASHLDVISKMIARVEQARATNAISRPELLRVMTEMGRVVQAYVTDIETLNRIRDGWLSIRL